MKIVSYMNYKDEGLNKWRLFMNKKVLLVIVLAIIIIAIILVFVFTNSDKDENINITNQIAIETIENQNNKEKIDTEANTVEKVQVEGEENMENARIKLTVNGNEIFVKLDDNQASRELLEMLPLTLTFEDFNSTEKIATLPNELSTEGLPSGYIPSVGDFSYYAPWGNLSIFYKDFRYSNSLYKLGTIEYGTEILGNISEDFEVSIERVN